MPGFPKTTLPGGNYGDFFSTNLEKGFAWISKKQYRQAETMVKFCENFGEGLRGFPKRNLGGRKLCGKFSRNLEKWFAWISKKQCWREETMGDFARNLEKWFAWVSRNFERVCVVSQKAMLAE